MWRFRPLPLSGRVPPRVCFPPLDFAGGGLINEPLLASDASPEAADNSPLRAENYDQYRQLLVNIKMKNYKIETVIIFILIMENYVYG